jgi:hypothetical protein
VGHFLSDPTGPINATLAFQANGNATAEDIKLAAERHMAAELLAFDNAFDQSTAGTTWEEMIPISFSTMSTAESA